MKIVLELNLPKELETLLERVGQAALVYTEGAMSFPAPVSSSSCANVQPAEPADVPVQDTQVSVQDSRPKTKKKAEQKVEPKVEAKPQVTLADAKVAILAIPNGHAIATAKLKERGKAKLVDLSTDELVDFLADLGVAS